MSESTRTYEDRISGPDVGVDGTSGGTRGAMYQKLLCVWGFRSCSENTLEFVP